MHSPSDLQVPQVIAPSGGAMPQRVPPEMEARQ